jgi:hypothetical protein
MHLVFVVFASRILRVGIMARDRSPCRGGACAARDETMSVWRTRGFLYGTTGGGF